MEANMHVPGRFAGLTARGLAEYLGAGDARAASGVGATKNLTFEGVNML